MFHLAWEKKKEIIVKTKFGFLLASFFIGGVNSYGAQHLPSYQCEIIGNDASSNPLVPSLPNPITVNQSTVDHILYVTFNNADSLRVGFSPYEGQLHLIADKKNSNGRFRPFASSRVPLGSPRISMDLLGSEGATVFLICILDNSAK